MTAATWEQARHFVECDCMASDRRVCVELTDSDQRECMCMCHRYISVEEIRAAAASERQQ